MHRTSAGLAAAVVVAAGVIAGCGGSGADGTGARTTAAPKSAPAASKADTVVVPKLVGLEQGRAHAAAQRAGLQMRPLGYVGKFGNGRYNVPCVKVMSQSPVAGERRPRGAFVSVLEKECKTPDSAPNPPAGTTGQPPAAAKAPDA